MRGLEWKDFTEAPTWLCGVILGLVIVLWPVAAKTQSAAAVGTDSSASAFSGSDASAIEATPTSYMGREIAQTMHFSGAEWLTRRSRAREEATSKLLAALHLEAGQNVCDLGCGNGYYTLRMARGVAPGGVVWAVDIQPEMLQLLERRANRAGLENIRPVLGELGDPKLPESEFDLLLLVDVYHEFAYPDRMLQKIRASLKPEGRVALAEYRLEDETVPIKLLHRMSKEQAVREYEENGFKLVEQYDELPWQHLLFFARDDSQLEEVEPTAWEQRP